MLTTTTSDFGGSEQAGGVVPPQVDDGNRQLGRTLQARSHCDDRDAKSRFTGSAGSSSASAGGYGNTFAH
jgi:hypothetical protein